MSLWDCYKKSTYLHGRIEVSLDWKNNLKTYETEQF